MPNMCIMASGSGHNAGSGNGCLPTGTLRELMASTLPHSCQFVVWFDVHGVLSELSRADCHALISALGRFGDRVAFGIMSYQVRDNRWPASAEVDCPWREVVQHSLLALFPDDRPHPSDLQTSDCAVYKRRDMPAHFWAVQGSKTSALASIAVPSLLVDDQWFACPPRHRCMRVYPRSVAVPNWLSATVVAVVSASLPVAAAGAAAAAGVSAASSSAAPAPAVAAGSGGSGAVLPKAVEAAQCLRAPEACRHVVWEAYRDSAGAHWYSDPDDDRNWFHSCTAAVSGWSAYRDPQSYRLWYWHEQGRLVMWVAPLPSSAEYRLEFVRSPDVSRDECSADQGARASSSLALHPAYDWPRS